MNRIIILLFGFLFSMGIYAAPVQIHFTKQWGDVDDEPIGHSGPRSLDQTPVVYIEDNTLMFESGHPGYTLRLLDEDDVVVFSDAISEGSTTFQLPSTLTGKYQIQLIYGNWIFIGWIEQ